MWKILLTWKQWTHANCKIMPDSPLLAPDSPLPAPNSPNSPTKPTSSADHAMAANPDPPSKLPAVGSYITAMVPGCKWTVPFYAYVLEVDEPTEEIRIPFLENKSHDSEADIPTKEAWILPRDVMISRVRIQAYARTQKKE
ncbi:hypothetical protein ACOMHN_061601 [Nucella lapillus]